MGRTRTVTRHRTSLKIAAGGLEFPSPEQRDPRCSVVVVMGVGSRTPTGLHWHEDKTEYIQVLEGHALVTLGEDEMVVGSDSGPLTIPRFTVHQYGRADEHPEGAASRDTDLRLLEWTEPADGQKEAFFRNIVSVMLDSGRGTGRAADSKVGGMLTMVLSIFTVLWHHDTYPAMLHLSGEAGKGWRGKLMRGFSHGVLGAVAAVGWLCGFKGSYPEYTPEELWLVGHQS